MPRQGCDRGDGPQAGIRGRAAPAGRHRPQDRRLRDPRGPHSGDHLADWHAYLVGKGSTQQHADLSRNRVARLIDLARARRISDLIPSRVQAALKAVRDKGVRRDEGVSLRSVFR